MKFAVFVYIMKESSASIPQYKSDKAVYNMFNDRSPVTLDISEHTANMSLSEIEYFEDKFKQVESVYIVNKFSNPITTIAHDINEDGPVTVLTANF